MIGNKVSGEKWFLAGNFYDDLRGRGWSASFRRKIRVDKSLKIAAGTAAGYSGARMPKQKMACFAFIVIASFAVYSNALLNGFVFDDLPQVLENRWIKDIRFIPDMFLHNVWSFGGGESNYYRPMMHLFYMLSYYLFGLRPWGFHLVNLCLHAGVSVLVFCVVAKLIKEPERLPFSPYVSVPLIAALLFALHPIHTEVVTPVMGITDLSFTFFYLLSFYLYIRSQEGAPWRYFTSVLFFFVAMLCKEPALTLPAVLLAYDYVSQKETFHLRRSLKKYIPYLLLIGLYFMMRLLALKGLMTRQIHNELSPLQYFINIFPLFTLYLEKLLLPVNLNFLHTFEHITSLFDLRGIFSLTVTLSFAGFTVFALRKRSMALLGLLFIVLPLLPALYIPALSQELRNAFAERYLYLPSVGFVLLLGCLMIRVQAKFHKAGRVLVISALVIAALYSIGALLRNPVWKDNYTLFVDTVNKSPDDGFARNGLGEALLKAGRSEEAFEQLQLAVRLKPNLATAYNNLGLVYRSQGMPERAIENYRLAVKFSPGYAIAYYNLGNIYGEMGWQALAIENYKIALTLKAEFAEAHNNLGIAYAQSGKLEQAIEQFKAAILLNPDDTNFKNNLARVYVDKRQLK